MNISLHIKNKKVFKLILLFILTTLSLGVLVGCDDNWWENLPDNSFESKCVTTDDGFKYYVDDDIGLCIIEVPDKKDVVIPEYIDDIPVKQLGYTQRSLGVLNYHVIDATHVKRFTLQHPVTVHYISLLSVETMVFVDIINFFDETKDVIRISNRIDGVHKDLSPNVELKNSSKQTIFEGTNLTVIEIPEYVTIIEAGVFDGLENVLIKTSYKSAPEGWEDGWNGTCSVEWGCDFS